MLTTALENKQIKVTVTDNGIGIPPNELNKIWERFHKVDQSRGGKLSGTGLGLSIAKHLVEAHGGTIQVESIMGQGTAFTFYLPLS